MNKKPKVFISYSHQDEEWRALIRKYFDASSLFDMWDDRDIPLGENWLQEIERASSEADIAIFLISVDFLNSKFINEKEVPYFLEQYRENGLHIAPIILYECPWDEREWLREIQGYPRDNKPLSSFWQNHNIHFSKCPNIIVQINNFIKQIYNDYTTKKEIEDTKDKSFIKDVFEHLEDRPLILFSPDSFNHTRYIDMIKQEAKSRFKDKLYYINCERYFGIEEPKEFLEAISQDLGFDEVKNQYHLIKKFEDIFKNNEPFKTFILVSGFERLNHNIMPDFAMILRTLYDQYHDSFYLIIFGGEKLIRLKYEDGIHSKFNAFLQKEIPEPSFIDFKQQFTFLDPRTFEEIKEITGLHPLLVEYCLKKKAKQKEEAKKVIKNSYIKNEIFRACQKEYLCKLVDKNPLGDFDPYCADEVLYRLYWNSLIKNSNGKFVWRSSFLQELGREVFKC